MNFNFGGEEYDCTCASIGNPHCVIITDEISREKCAVSESIPRVQIISRKELILIVKVLDKNNIQIEIFERGVGYTLSSATCSCAAAGAALKQGLISSDVMVHTREEAVDTD